MFGTEEAGGTGSTDWERIKPMLDEAIDELPGQDRDAVILRFLEHREFCRDWPSAQMSTDAAGCAPRVP